jgi:hypothetical protein
MANYLITRKQLLQCEIEAKNKQEAIEKALEQDEWKITDTCRNDVITNCKAEKI